MSERENKNVRTEIPKQDVFQGLITAWGSTILYGILQIITRLNLAFLGLEIFNYSSLFGLVLDVVLMPILVLFIVSSKYRNKFIFLFPLGFVSLCFVAVSFDSSPISSFDGRMIILFALGVTVFVGVAIIAALIIYMVFLVLEKFRSRSKWPYLVVGGILGEAVLSCLIWAGLVRPYDPMWEGGYPTNTMVSYMECILISFVAGALAAYAFWKTAVEKYQLKNAVKK